MRAGTDIHELLEREVSDTVEITAHTREDAWAVKFVNMLVNLRTLELKGIAREIPVIGRLGDFLVFGVIDQVERREGSAQAGTTAAPRFVLSDTKTRSWPSLPDPKSSRPARVQVAMYWRMYSDLVDGCFDLAFFEDKLGGARSDDGTDSPDDDYDGDDQDDENIRGPPAAADALTLSMAAGSPGSHSPPGLPALAPRPSQESPTTPVITLVEPAAYEPVTSMEVLSPRPPRLGRRLCLDAPLSPEVAAAALPWLITIDPAASTAGNAGASDKDDSLRMTVPAVTPATLRAVARAALAAFRRAPHLDTCAEITYRDQRSLSLLGTVEVDLRPDAPDATWLAHRLDRAVAFWRGRLVPAHHLQASDGSWPALTPGLSAAHSAAAAVVSAKPPITPPAEAGDTAAASSPTAIIGEAMSALLPSPDSLMAGAELDSASRRCGNCQFADICGFRRMKVAEALRDCGGAW